MHIPHSRGFFDRLTNITFFSQYSWIQYNTVGSMFDNARTDIMKSKHICPTKEISTYSVVCNQNLEKHSRNRVNILLNHIYDTFFF